MVVPIHATPFGVVTLPGAVALNGRLAGLFAARAAADLAPQRNPLCFRSQDDLLASPDETVRALAVEIFRGLNSVVAAVNTLPDDVFASLKLEARGWFTVVQPGGCIPAASHSLTAWCGVYCVAAPGAAVERRDSGVLRLYESRLGTMFSDATNSAMRVPYTPGHIIWRPVPGELAVFPGWITHEIATLRATEPLVLVTVRARFVGPEQTGVGRW